MNKRCVFCEFSVMNLHSMSCIYKDGKCFKEEKTIKNLYEYMPRTCEMTAVEEMAELTQVISKVKRYGINDKLYANLIEELADVYLMLEIIKEKYSVNDQAVDINMKFKLERLIQRIKEDREGKL